MNIKLLYVLLPIVAIAPVFFIKKYVSNKNSDKKYILFALIGYIFLTYLYIKLLKKGDMTKIFYISQIMQMLMIFIGSILIYAEEITVNKIIGVIISISSIYFFSK
jgi:drug/metabolite transporter (DMT)-like permease